MPEDPEKCRNNGREYLGKKRTKKTVRPKGFEPLTLGSEVGRQTRKPLQFKALLSPRFTGFVTFPKDCVPV
jgi:hypothetical protein